jgi:ArsR family transcriptional regulator
MQELPNRKFGTRCCDTIGQQAIHEEDAERLSDDLQMLAHPVRLQILNILARHAGQVCVCDLEAALPVKQPTVSHHLRLLRAAGIIDCERHGQWAYYFIQHDRLTQIRERITNLLSMLTPDSHR